MMNLASNLQNDNLDRGYRMIKTLKIENFRCFDSIEIKDFSRINVLVGKNASGKSALLEALYLVTGESPIQSLEIRNWRGQSSAFTGYKKDAYDSLWKDLFYDLDTKRKIFIEFTDSLGIVPRSLQISFSKSELLVMQYKDEPSGLLSSSGAIVFTYKAEDGEDYPVVPTISPQGIVFTGKIPPNPIVTSGFLAAQMPSSSKIYTDYFSSLSKQNKHNEIVNLLKKEFDFIEGITVEIGSAGEPTLYASVRGLSEKIPVSLLSSGVSKLLCILLGIALHPKGIFLIDEIENGFYYDRLPLIWPLILQFAQQYQVQVFATTHSWECLEAARDIAEKHPELFSIMRTVRSDGKTEIRQFGGKRFVDAVDESIEIR